MRDEYEDTLHIKGIFEKIFLSVFFIVFPPLDLYLKIYKSEEMAGFSPLVLLHKYTKKQPNRKSLVGCSHAVHYADSRQNSPP